MPTRETLHALVEALPEETWATVEPMLRRYARPSEGQAPAGAERAEAARRGLGMFAHAPTSSEEFARRKQEEIDLEDRRW